MNKKILISLSVIGAVAALAIGGTIAYFSDTETSTGNTFTAGTLDLIVDIDGRVDNPLDEPLFTLGDIKPGDEYEQTISLFVQNDACGFVTFDLTSDLDNTCTEPEEDAEGTPCDADGELNENVDWSIWLDQGLVAGWQCAGVNNGCTADPAECNNVEDDPALEPELLSGALVADKSYGFGKMDADVHYCYGMELDLDSSVGNDVQSDSFTADMILKVEQYRNQYGEGTENPNGCPTGEIVCEYNVNPTGQPYEDLYGSWVTPVDVTDTDCSVTSALKVEHTQNFQQGQPESQPAGWAGWSCVQPGYPNAIGGGVIPADADVYAQGLAETGAPAINGYNYPTYPHYTFPANEEGWVVEAAGTTPPTSVYVICAQ